MSPTSPPTVQPCAPKRHRQAPAAQASGCLSLACSAQAAAPGPVSQAAPVEAAAAAPGASTRVATGAIPGADAIALLQAVGLREGLQRPAAEFVDRLRADGRVSGFFCQDHASAPEAADRRPVLPVAARPLG